MKRVLLKSLLTLGAIVGVVLLVAGGLVIWVAGTESGLQFTWRRVATRLPADIEIQAVEGRLTGPLTLSNVAVRSETLELTIERAELTWNPRALLDRTFEVQRLAVRGVDVVQFPATGPLPDADEPFQLPERIDLPIDILIGAASVEAFNYRSSPEAEALLIERTTIAGHFIDDELVLREFVVRSPLFDITGEASIVPGSVYETNGRLDWTFRPGDYPDANGSTRFVGNLRGFTIEQRIEAPYNAQAEVLVQEPLTALRLDGELAFTVQPAALGVEDPPVDTVDSRLSFRGALDELDLVGRVAIAGGPADAVEAELEGRYAERVLEIETLDLVDPGSDAAIRVTGRVTTGTDEAALDLDATWSQVQWPLRGDPQVESDSGALELRGTLSDYALALDAAMALADGTAGRVRVSGIGSAEALELEQIDVEVLQGRVVGHAAARWRPELAGAVELTGSDLDPAVLASAWPGRLGARVRAEAAIDGQDLTVTFHELTADGRLRDRPIELSAKGGYSTDTLRLDTLSLRSGSSEIDAHGTAGADVALEWRIESPDLGDVWPGLVGQLSAGGELNGPRLRPQVSVEARAQALRFMGSSIDELDLKADIDIAGDARSALELSATAAEAQGTEIQQFKLTGVGNAARHELAVTTTTNAGNAEIELAGSVAEPWTQNFAWTFDLDTATVAYLDFLPWQLREPARGRVTRTRAELGQTCWQSGTANLCVEGLREPGRTEAAFALTQLPFKYLAALLVEPVDVEGEISIEGTFDQLPNGMPHLNAELRTSPGRLDSVDPGDPAKPYALVFGPADGRITMNDDRMEGSLLVPLEDRGELEIRARVGSSPGAPFQQRSLDGELLIDVASLDFVADILSELQDTQGALRGDLRVSGTVGEPRIAGTLALDNGKATLPQSNVVIEDLELELAGDGARGLTVEAQASSGGGSLSAEGRVALAETGPQGRISVSGEAFEIIDTLDAQIVVSPDLDLVLADDGLELTGSVTVPRARLTPRDTGESVVAVSKDQVIVDTGDEANRAPSRPFSAKVQLALGDEVNLEAYGLTGRLGGAIQITETSGEPTTGSGELRVEEGVYEAYGQKLEIRTGRLVFAGGPISEPGLNIEAVRRPAENILVGARVRGALDAPEISVFSEPPMPQQEQLSYLVLGRPLDSTSASESSAMSRAALALGLKGGNFVSERVNENLGLDEFGIQTEPGQAATEASFVIGKYLTPSLYVSYGIGLFEPVNTLKLRYTISERWQLLTESSSEASSGDLIYNIERGR